MPGMSRNISTKRRNLQSSMRSNRQSPNQVPAATAGTHQKYVVYIAEAKMPSLAK
jgi:hypothetical protein